MWYLAHAYQHTRLREIASPARCSSFLLCCYPNKEPIKMIGKKNYTYLTKDQPYQRLCNSAKVETLVKGLVRNARLTVKALLYFFT
jgi:hypothetical protein